MIKITSFHEMIQGIDDFSTKERGAFFEQIEKVKEDDAPQMNEEAADERGPLEGERRSVIRQGEVQSRALKVVGRAAERG